MWSTSWSLRWICRYAPAFSPLLLYRYVFDEKAELHDVLATDDYVHVDELSLLNVNDKRLCVYANAPWGY